MRWYYLPRFAKIRRFFPSTGEDVRWRRARDFFLCGAFFAGFRAGRFAGATFLDLAAFGLPAERAFLGLAES